MLIARSKKFDKQYKRLSRKIREQFADRLKLYLEDQSHPLLHAHNLAGPYRGSQSFNVNADVRAVFMIKDGDTIYFSAIGSHSELYG